VKYGLSPELHGKTVQAKIYYDKIEVFYDHSLLKTLRRSYNKYGENSDWKDYLPSLVKKPGATEHTRFFNQMPKLWQDYLKSVKGQERKFFRPLSRNPARRNTPVSSTRCRSCGRII